VGNTNLRISPTRHLRVRRFITLDDGNGRWRVCWNVSTGSAAKISCSGRGSVAVRRVVQINGAAGNGVGPTCPLRRRACRRTAGCAPRVLSLRSATSMRPRIGGRRWNKLTLAHGCLLEEVRVLRPTSSIHRPLRARVGRRHARAHQKPGCGKQARAVFIRGLTRPACSEGHTMRITVPLACAAVGKGTRRGAQTRIVRIMARL